MPFYLEVLKQRVVQHFKSSVLFLGALLFLLLYLTSLLSKSTTITDPFFDLFIYILYFFLVLILASAALLSYLYLEDPDPVVLLEPKLLVKSEEAVEKSSVLERVEDEVLDEKAPYLLWLEKINMVDAFKSKNDKGFRSFEGLTVENSLSFLRAQQPQLALLILMHLEPSYQRTLFEGLTETEQQKFLSLAEVSKIPKRESLDLIERFLERTFNPLADACSYLRGLEDQALRVLLKAVDKKELMFALKGATKELQEKFFANMSPKASAEFQRVMDAFRQTDQQISTQAIKNLYLLAQQLREDGRIRTRKEV